MSHKYSNRSNFAGVLGAVILLAALAIYYLHKTRRHRRGVVCIRRSSVSRLTVLPTSPVVSPSIKSSVNVGFM